MEKEMIYREQKSWFYMEEDGKIIINLDEVELDKEASNDTQLVYRRKERKPKVWSELGNAGGCRPMCDGTVVRDNLNAKTHKHLTACTDKHAKAMIAFAKISQLMPYYGGEAGMDSKYFYFLTYWPRCNNGTFKVYGRYRDMQAPEIIYPRFTEYKYAVEFIKHEENVQLLKDLYMID